MAELALVLPMFLVVLFGIVLLGMAVFFQQQLTNAAREAARFASIHSATAVCPVTGSYDPVSPPLSYPLGAGGATGGCDRKADGWPRMTAFARGSTFGMDRSGIRVSACWSGYRKDTVGGAIDAPPPGTFPNLTTVWAQCQIGGQDPTAMPDSIPCAAGLATTDQASSMSESAATPVANTVTAYACYVWRPPLGGISLPIPGCGGFCWVEIIPSTVTQRAVITEPIERQQ
jgi:hypothetical protein